MNKSIYDLKLHEEMEVSRIQSAQYVTGTTKAMRVPGGWLYNSFQHQDNGITLLTSTFVPYNTEFMPKGKNDVEMLCSSHDYLADRKRS